MIHYQDDAVTVHHGDCLDVMRELADCSIDAVVTDPPYEINFMSRSWDGRGVAFDPATWRLVLRVLKPGGHMLAFGGTRTWHRLACAIEDAGFEIRDSIHWIYGSGFAKSLQPYRKLMPCPLTERAPHVVRLSEWHRLDSPAAKEHTALALAETQPGGDLQVLIRTGAEVGTHALTVTSLSDWTMGATSWNTVSSCRGYSVESWQPTSTSITSTMTAAITDPRTSNSCRSLLTAASMRPPATQADGCECDAATAATRSTEGSWSFSDTRTPIARERVTAPLAPLSGLGTATKPAHEPIIVARKPLDGTVSANVLRWGTGALNVDGCRVEGERSGDPLRFTKSTRKADTRSFGKGADGDGGMYDPGRPLGVEVSTAGRWPPNVVLSHAPDCILPGDEPCDDAPDCAHDGDCQRGPNCRTYCPVAELDRQSGTIPAGDGRDWSKERAHGTGTGPTFLGVKPTGQHYGDSGGASRFFPTFRYEQSCALYGMLSECERNPSEWWTTPALTAVSSSATSLGTNESIAPRAASTKPDEPNGQPASSAVNLCASCATAIARSLAPTDPAQPATRALGLPSTADYSERILTRNLALIAADLANNDTTPTTVDWITSYGCAVDAISTYITRASQHGSRKSARNSEFVPWKYEPKAPTSERPRVAKDGAGNGRVTGLGGKVRQCNVCETRAIESGASEPSCGHGNYRWADPTHDPVAARPEGVMPSGGGLVAHPT